MVRRGGVGGWLLASLVVGCSSFGDAGPGDVPADAGGGATTSATDAASPDAGAPDADGDAGGGDAAVQPQNLLDNGDFELGCAGWTAGGTSPGPLSGSDDARSGKTACLVCGGGTGPFDVYQRLSAKVAANEQYAAEAWVKKPATKAISTVEAAFIQYDMNGAQTRAPTSGSPTSTWTRVTALATMKAGTVQLEFSVASQEPSTNCFLVDDARVYRLK